VGDDGVQIDNITQRKVEGDRGLPLMTYNAEIASKFQGGGLPHPPEDQAKQDRGGQRRARLNEIEDRILRADLDLQWITSTDSRCSGCRRHPASAGSAGARRSEHQARTIRPARRRTPTLQRRSCAERSGVNRATESKLQSMPASQALPSSNFLGSENPPSVGALGEIRTPDPQIRSLVLCGFDLSFQVRTPGRIEQFHYPERTGFPG
jgi:hypothetical protein